MKIQKSNNPLAVGALLCVLTLIVGRTIWLVTRGDGSAQMVSAVPTPPAAPVSGLHPAAPDVVSPSAVAHSSAPSAPLPARPNSTRNPFAVHRPSPPVPAQGVSERTAAAPTKSQPTGDFSIAEVRPLPPLSVGPLPVSRSVGLRPLSQTAKTAALAPAPPEPDPLQNIRLTAIVDGTRRMAVLQTAAPQPLIVHEGDSVQGLQVTAIHDREVVFTRDGKSWPLPLQTADTTVTVTTNEAAPAAQENTTDATP